MYAVAGVGLGDVTSHTLSLPPTHPFLGYLGHVLANVRDMYLACFDIV